jgi:hypothetical protein
LKALDGGVWKTRIAEPEPANGYLRWHGDVYANRARLKSGVGRETMRRRGELIERSFAHILDRGGMRKAKYPQALSGSCRRVHLAVLMRALHGQGTPREAADARAAFIFVLRTDDIWFSASSRSSTTNTPPLLITVGLTSAPN